MGLLKSIKRMFTPSGTAQDRLIQQQERQAAAQQEALQQALAAQTGALQEMTNGNAAERERKAALEAEALAESRRQFEEQQKQEAARQSEIATAVKKRSTDAATAALSGFFGYRSLLSGRKGGGGFSTRSMTDGLKG